MMMRSGFAKSLTGGHQRIPGQKAGLAAMGRHGDTELAHVTPEEKQLLRQRGGSGTRNPFTGLSEYWTSVGGPGSSSFGSASTADRESYTDSQRDGVGNDSSESFGIDDATAINDALFGGRQDSSEPAQPSRRSLVESGRAAALSGTALQDESLPSRALGWGAGTGMNVLNTVGGPLGFSGGMVRDPNTRSGFNAEATLNPLVAPAYAIGGPGLAGLARKFGPEISLGTGFEGGVGGVHKGSGSTPEQRTQMGLSLLNEVLGREKPAEASDPPRASPRHTPFRGDATAYGSAAAPSHTFFRRG